VPFYGIGDSSSRDAATEYGYRPTTVGVTMRYTPRRALTFGGGADYLQISATANAVHRWRHRGRPPSRRVRRGARPVADRARDLSLTHLRESYGIGARFHAQSGTMLRWELAHSREHALRFIWSFGVAF
jgi:hypothetical protein